jgi:hypothetical protein
MNDIVYKDTNSDRYHGNIVRWNFTVIHFLKTLGGKDIFCLQDQSEFPKFRDKICESLGCTDDFVRFKEGARRGRSVLPELGPNTETWVFWLKGKCAKNFEPCLGELRYPRPNIRIECSGFVFWHITKFKVAGGITSPC